jgi:hypothetical protein
MEMTRLAQELEKTDLQFLEKQAILDALNEYRASLRAHVQIGHQPGYIDDEECKDRLAVLEGL